jgi:hypothetical protein
MWLEAIKCTHVQRHEFKERKKIFDQNKLSDEFVKNLVPQYA